MDTNDKKTNTPPATPEAKAFELPASVTLESLAESHGLQYARSLYRQICAAGRYGQLLDEFGEANAPALDLVDLDADVQATIAKILTK